MIASLAMYDFGDLVAANDRFWALIRDAMRADGLAAPDALTRGDGACWPAWESPGLVLSQTCGLPYRARLHDRVTLVCTPDYGVEDAPPGYYRSLFIARADDPRTTLADFADARFGFSDALSQSGWGAPWAFASWQGFDLRHALPTGAHRLSVAALNTGRADYAAIDAVTWRHIARNEPGTIRGLKVIGRTDPGPGLPFIAGNGADGAQLHRLITLAFEALSEADKATLGIRLFVRIPEATYLALPLPPAPVLNAAAE
jgi:ABC-type phosphate/phosphonate transport system substrate-binding protein